MKESSLDRKILKYLNGIKGCRAEKIMGTAFQRDRPDINGCWHGHMFKIEDKIDPKGYQVTPGQRLELKLWRKAGATTFVAYTLEDVKKYIGEDYMAVPDGNGWKYIGKDGKDI